MHAELAREFPWRSVSSEAGLSISKIGHHQSSHFILHPKFHSRYYNWETSVYKIVTITSSFSPKLNMFNVYPVRK
jgi:hypothetical protein